MRGDVWEGGGVRGDMWEGGCEGRCVGGGGGVRGDVCGG